jgi:hypothetical protein
MKASARKQTACSYNKHVYYTADIHAYSLFIQIFCCRGNLLSCCLWFHYQYRQKLSSPHNSQYGYTFYFKPVMWSWRLSILIDRHGLQITHSL